MTDAPAVRLRPVVSWPARVEPGGSYRVSVDLETEGPPDEWPYPEEEYAVGCMLDGGTGFAVESVGDTTLVVHRFGGTYGPVTFVAHALDAQGDELCLTLVTQGGVPFRTIPLNVDRSVLMDAGGGSGAAEPAPPYSLVPYPPEPEEIADPWSLPLSRVLAAASRSIPFTGREDELLRLRSWRDGDAGTVLLLHGPGGQGKTRLAAEFARRSRQDGWQVLAARHGERSAPGGAPHAAPPGEPDAAGLLLVVDYAETWPIEDLLDMLGESASGRWGTVRVLLIARPAGAWWVALASRLGHGGVETATMELESLLGDGRMRREGFLTAVAWFADLFGRPDVAVGAFTHPLADDPAFEQVLAVQMAALSAVLNPRVSWGGRNRRSAVPATLLRAEERDYWERELADGTIGTTANVMERVMCVASLIGPVPEDEAERLLRELGVREPSTALRDHRHCYPPARPHTVLQPVSPDRLAEDYLALMIQDDVWMTGALRTVLHGRWGAAAVGVLVETARRWPLMARVLNVHLRERPDPAVEAGGAVLLRLAEAPDTDPAVLAAIEERLPRERRIDLDIAGAVLAERLFADRLAAAAGDPARQAALYERLSERRANVGMYEEAQRASASAVALRRTLSAERGDAGTADALAESLTISSGHLGRMGRHEEGLRQLVESVEVLRGRAADHPEAFGAQLASGLNAQALALAELGRRQESLAAVEEAVALYRERPGAYRAELASALNNLSARLAALGRLEEGLAAVAEAVAIHRELDAEEPDAHLPALAAGLHNLSLRQAELGLAEQAAESAMEAVRMQRRLTATVPGAYEASLAGALDNLSTRLGELGRWDEAAAAIEEAVASYRTLAEQRPETYRADLAAALNNYSVELGELGRSRESLAAVQEAVAAYRLLADQRPDAYRPDLAAALNNLSVRLAELGDHEGGLDVIREAVGIRRRLAADDPAAFAADLAMSLANLGDRLNQLGRFSESVRVVEEAVAIYRGLAEDRPDAFLPALAGSLGKSAITRGLTGEMPGAIAVSAEAVSIYRWLCRKQPTAFLALLARSLHNHSTFLGNQSRFEEGLVAAHEAASIYRSLVQGRPGVFSGPLARSLLNLARHQAVTGRRTEAAVSARDAVLGFRELVSGGLENHEENLAQGLHFLGALLSGSDEGLAAVQEAVQIYSGLSGRRLSAPAGPAAALEDLARRLGDRGRLDEAAERARAAVALYRGLEEGPPREYAVPLASCLVDLARFLELSGRAPEAREAATEAAGLARVHRTGPMADLRAAAEEMLDRLDGAYGGSAEEGGS
ncbi:tetratricopeptide repeat protein [Actinomadura madurae]|uniref:tetratricopeptide repeat protein n=1 Tax=Actinomadura madurae TaxID=1993 RepID=UPI00399BCB00